MNASVSFKDEVSKEFYDDEHMILKTFEIHMSGEGFISQPPSQELIRQIICGKFHTHNYKLEEVDD